jgi:hypothetical protein
VPLDKRPINKGVWREIYLRRNLGRCGQRLTGGKEKKTTESNKENGHQTPQKLSTKDNMTRKRRQFLLLFQVANQALCTEVISLGSYLLKLITKSTIIFFPFKKTDNGETHSPFEVTE